MKDSQAACSHARVKYVRVEENGFCHDTWRCESGCGVYFWPGPSAQDVQAAFERGRQAGRSEEAAYWEPVHKAKDHTAILECTLCRHLEEILNAAPVRSLAQPAASGPQQKLISEMVSYRHQLRTALESLLQTARKDEPGGDWYIPSHDPSLNERIIAAREVLYNTAIPTSAASAGSREGQPEDWDLLVAKWLVQQPGDFYWNQQKVIEFAKWVDSLEPLGPTESPLARLVDDVLKFYPVGPNTQYDAINEALAALAAAGGTGR